MVFLFWGGGIPTFEIQNRKKLKNSNAPNIPKCQKIRNKTIH